MDIHEAAAQFLASEGFAVAGVSRKGDVAANTVYKKLRDAGRKVYAINPNADTVEGDPCFPDLAALPSGVEAVIIATHPAQAPGMARQCIEHGVRWVWMHRGIGAGSVDEEAQRLLREAGVGVIPGACPVMFLEPVDPGHKCMRWFLRATNSLPQPEGF